MGRRWAGGGDGPSPPTQGGTWGKLPPGNAGPRWILPRRERWRLEERHSAEEGGEGGNSVELLCGGSVSYVVIGSQIPGQRARAGVLQGSTLRGHPGPRGRAAIILSTPEVSEARRGGVSWPGPSGWIALVRVLGEAAVLEASAAPPVLPAPVWAPPCAPWLTRCGQVVDDLSETQFPQFQSRANST